MYYEFDWPIYFVLFKEKSTERPYQAFSETATVIYAMRYRARCNRLDEQINLSCESAVLSPQGFASSLAC